MEDLETNLNAADNLKEDCKEGILIFTDLVGGSPFKTSVEISLTREKNRCSWWRNLGMLVEISMAKLLWMM